MEVDKITKFLMAVIALNLSIITVKDLNIFPRAKATENNLGLNNSNFQNYSLVPVNADGSLSVKLVNSDEIDVNIVGIKTTDEMDINIDEVACQSLSWGDPVPVKVK